jgi:ribosomal protein S18 acetylase RimI-like enzyme
LSLRERLLGVYLAAALFVRSWLPRSLERWIWNVSKQERTIREKTRGVLERRREAIKRCLPREASETDYLILNSLNVLPEYERKGIGKTLMQQGLDMANENKVAIYLAASPAGKGLYERMGFEVLEEYEVGYQDIHTWKETIMRYQPV